jgi:hypothetical protein
VSEKWWRGLMAGWRTAACDCAWNAVADADAVVVVVVVMVVAAAVVAVAVVVMVAVERGEEILVSSPWRGSSTGVGEKFLSPG